MVETLSGFLGGAASVLIKLATVGFCVAAAFYTGLGIMAWRSTTAAWRTRRRELEELSKSRRRDPTAFLSYARKNQEIAERCAEVLADRGYEVIKYDPGNLWQDPAGEVIESIETANVLLYVGASIDQSDWIRGEIDFGKKYDIPFFEAPGHLELSKLLDDIDGASTRVDLVERLGDAETRDRYRVAFETFEPYIDNSEDHLYGSEWLSTLNMTLKQGGGEGQEVLVAFFGFLRGGMCLLGALGTGLVWLLLL